MSISIGWGAEECSGTHGFQARILQSEALDTQAGTEIRDQRGSNVKK
jgi:hypothetical protein